MAAAAAPTAYRENAVGPGNSGRADGFAAAAAAAAAGIQTD